jgi:uncharacterized membrane protein YbhN (UPF0104 family)
MPARRKSLAERWLERAPHPIVTLAIVGLLEGAAVVGLIYAAGWREILHAISKDNVEWFGVCAAGQLVAYFGYAISYRAAAGVDGGIRLPFTGALAVVSAGFGPMFAASASGGFSVDYATLRQAGLSARKAFRRVLGLSVLEYAVLAPAVAVCAVLVYLHVGGHAPASVTLPWLAVVPGALAAAWLTSPRRARRFRSAAADASRLRRGFGHAVAALELLRTLIAGWRTCWWAFAGAALYWAGDILTFWAALRCFGVQLATPALVVAYGTGWALTRRSLPFGGPGLVEVVLAFALTWFGVPFAPAAAGVVAYRLFNFWLSLIPAAAILPFSDRIERRIVRA